MTLVPSGCITYRSWEKCLCTSLGGEHSLTMREAPSGHWSISISVPSISVLKETTSDSLCEFQLLALQERKFPQPVGHLPPEQQASLLEVLGLYPSSLLCCTRASLLSSLKVSATPRIQNGLDPSARVY